MEWEKSSLIEYCLAHQQETILIEDVQTKARILGSLGEVNEMDLCSTTLVEASVLFQTPNLYVTLTFHEKFLGVNVILEGDQQQIELSIPHQISYENLRIQNTRDEAFQGEV